MTFLTALTIVHTALSIVAILAGLIAIGGLFRSSASRGWTSLFIWTAVATSVTGIPFLPFKGVTPAQIVGVLALAILAVVLLASYRYRLHGAWRWIYAAGMVASLYLLVFVGVVQAFQKIAALKALAPTGSEPAFAVAQGAVLIVFVAVGVLAAVRYRPPPPPVHA